VRIAPLPRGEQRVCKWSAACAGNRLHEATGEGSWAAGDPKPAEGGALRVYPATSRNSCNSNDTMRRISGAVSGAR